MFTGMLDFPHQVKDQWDIWEETETQLNFGNLSPESVLTGDVTAARPKIEDYLKADKGEARNIKIAALVVFGFTLNEVAVAERITSPRVRQILHSILKKYVKETREYSLYQLRRTTTKVYVLKALLNA